MPTVIARTLAFHISRRMGKSDDKEKEERKKARARKRKRERESKTAARIRRKLSESGRRSSNEDEVARKRMRKDV